MLSQAHETAMHEGLQLDEPIWVPGSMEKPLALKKELKREAIVGAVTPVSYTHLTLPTICSV